MNPTIGADEPKNLEVDQLCTVGIQLIKFLIIYNLRSSPVTVAQLVNASLLELKVPSSIPHSVGVFLQCYQLGAGLRCLVA